MINGQRQTWSNGRATEPATYWILSVPGGDHPSSIDVYNKSLLTSGRSATANTVQIQLLNLSGQSTAATSIAWSNIYPRSASFDSAGNVYIAGTIIQNTGNVWIGKLNTTISSIVWQKEFRSTGNLSLSGNDNMIIIPDGHIIVGGVNSEPAGDNGWLSKIDASGNIVWTATQNYSVNYIAADSANNIYVLGDDGDFDGSINGNVFLSKYNSSGIRQWNTSFTKYYPASPTTNGFLPTGLTVDTTDTPWISGFTATAIISPTRNTLIPIWAANGAAKSQLGLYGPNGLRVRALTTATSGNIALAADWSTSGETGDNGLLLEINASGSIAWSGSINSTQPNDSSFDQIVFGANSDIYTNSLADTGQPALFALGNNFSTTGTYNNGGETYDIWPNSSVLQEAGNIIVTTGATISNSSFTGSSYVSSSTTLTAPIYPARSYTPIKTNPPPPEPYTVEYLAVGGGGGTPARIGGGGGGGGVLTGNITLDPGVVYTANVGPGGIGRLGSEDVIDVGAAGSNGNNTVISGTGITTITAIGGGAGGMVNGSGFIYPSTGGSGGGGSTAENGMSGAGAAGTAGQGYAGGTGYAAPIYGGGGGGGAGAVGGNRASSGTASAVGGDGIQSSITGTATYYGGGGGSSSYAGGSGVGGAGGAGGGGTGGNALASGQNGTDGLGGGGGANGGGDFATSAKGGDGGDGVVIFRILTSNYTGTISGNTTVTTDGSYTVLKFNANSTYTA
jgi:hypothetical protein